MFEAIQNTHLCFIIFNAPLHLAGLDIMKAQNTLPLVFLIVFTKLIKTRWLRQPKKLSYVKVNKLLQKKYINYLHTVILGKGVTGINI